MILHCPELGRDIEPLKKAAGPKTTVIRAPRMKVGEEGCLAAHQAAVADAVAAGADRVWVMEDDCVLNENFSFDKWASDAEWAKANGYTVLVSGSVRTWNPRFVHDGLIAVDRCCSAHSVVYFREAFPAVMKARVPVDLSVVDFGARQLLVWPFVAVQGKGFSGIKNTQIDYDWMYRKEEKRLGYLRDVRRQA